jgi:hypothetical protein
LAVVFGDEHDVDLLAAELRVVPGRAWLAAVCADFTAG